MWHCSDCQARACHASPSHPAEACRRLRLTRQKHAGAARGSLANDLTYAEHSPQPRSLLLRPRLAHEGQSMLGQMHSTTTGNLLLLSFGALCGADAGMCPSHDLTR